MAALLWVADHVGYVGAHADAITIGGGSASGNISAAFALKARDERGLVIALQPFEVPVLT